MERIGVWGLSLLSLVVATYSILDYHFVDFPLWVYDIIPYCQYGLFGYSVCIIIYLNSKQIKTEIIKDEDEDEDEDEKGEGEEIT